MDEVNPIYEVAELLLACTKECVTNMDPCCCIVTPEPVPRAEREMIFVSIGNVFPTADFPNALTDTSGSRCKPRPHDWAVELNFGVTRCVPIRTDKNFADCQDLGECGFQQTEDICSMFKAVKCCFQDDVPCNDRMKLVINSILPLPASDEGYQTVLGSILVEVRMPELCCK